MAAEIKPTAELVGKRSEYARAAAYVTGLDRLPLGRVVNDAKVADHHAIIPTRAEHGLDKMSNDDRRVYDLVARRFLAVFHPDAVFENTRLETTVAEHVFRTRGRVLLEAGWRAVYGEGLDDRSAGDEDEGSEQALPKLARDEPVQTLEVAAEEKVTKPPRRYSDASLLAAMETAGKLVDDDELREAMKDSGIGTPATRAAIIERLIEVGYVERDARSLVATEKGVSVVRLLGEHPLTSPTLTGDWEHRLGRIEHGEETRERFMKDIAEFARGTVGELDAKLKEVRIPRANLGPCPVCGQDIVENRKGFSCWSRDDPGCGFVIWKSKAGKNAAGGRGAGADLHRPYRARGHGLQGPHGQVVPRAARAAAGRGRQMARRVRRAVGAGGRPPARAGGRRRRRGRDAGHRRRGRSRLTRAARLRCVRRLAATAEARDHRDAVPAAGDERPAQPGPITRQCGANARLGGRLAGGRAGLGPTRTEVGLCDRRGLRAAQARPELDDGSREQDERGRPLRRGLADRVGDGRGGVAGLGRPDDEERGAVGRGGDAPRERPVGIGVGCGEIQLGHGVLPWVNPPAPRTTQTAAILSQRTT